MLEDLTRSDKWYLGSGGRLLWAPRYPAWLDRPGCWDELHFDHHALYPVFAVALLDEFGREIPLKGAERRWRPDRISQPFAGSGVSLDVTKSISPSDVLVSTLDITNENVSAQTLHVVVWTLIRQDSHRQASRPQRSPNGWEWKLQLRPDDEPRAAVACELSLSALTSTSARLSQEGPLQPLWMLTPFCDGFDGALDGAHIAAESPQNGAYIYLGLHAHLELDAGASTAIHAGFHAADADESIAPRSEARLASNAEAASVHWRRAFETVPTFTCSDEHIQTYYKYRWYGLHLFTDRSQKRNYAYPGVFEGPGYFRKLISYSAPCHMRETRWMDDASVAQGSLLNFVHNQLPDGRFYGHLFRGFGHNESFYHARWSHVMDVHRIHPDRSFLERAYDGLSAYAEHFDRDRDPEGSGLYDILNHYETGQEYMHRYVAVEKDADKIHWGRQFRLKGVDASVYQYEIRRALAEMAHILGRPRDAEQWNESADAVRTAVRSRMWDEEAQMFFDVEPRTGRRTGVKAATCFYPYMTDIVEERHLEGLKRHIFEPSEFWTPYPVPSSSADDPYFSSSPHWKGQRMNCPWNGRVWPMANSHVAEALGTTADRFGDADLRHRTAEFVRRFIHMMFFDGDAGRPNCFEHYNPMTGSPSAYRGVDDYQHSWVVDLIMRYVCGIRPTNKELVVDPFPFDLGHARIDGVPFRGRRISIEIEADDFRVAVDGEPARESRMGNPVVLPLEVATTDITRPS